MEQHGPPVSKEENRAAQAEEMEALHAIYEDDYKFYPDGHFCEIQVYPTADARAVAIRLRVYFVDSYPSACEPVAELRAPWISEETKQKILAEFGEIYRQGARGVVIFQWVDWLQGQSWVWEEAQSWAENVATINQHLKKDDKLKPKHKPSLSEQSYLIEDDSLRDCTSPVESPEDLERKNLEELDRALGIVHGPPFTEKKSVFQAHLAAVHGVDEVEVVMDALLRNRKIAGATHNIMAYRINVPDKGTVLQDFDDDGENAAGGRLMHLLQIVDASDVVVVVSRWFGGVLLGPDRFRFINNAARSILSTCGYIAGNGTSGHHKNQPKPTPARTTVTLLSRRGRKK